MSEVLTEPVSAPSVWRGDELADTARWIVHFTEEDFADFKRALAHVARRHLEDVTEIRAEDFPLPRFQERIDDVVDRLERGLGLVLLRGLPIHDRFGVDEARPSSTTPRTQRVNGTCSDRGSADPKPADRSAPSTPSGAAATRRDLRQPGSRRG